jgi:arylsulfatase
VNENKLFNGIPDAIEANLPHLDELGSPLTYNHYPTGWACAFNTPFKLWKRYSNWEGGTADPMIVSWPAQITSTGVRRQYVHAVDIVPTLYSLLGIDPPEVVKGYTQYALEGISFDATLNDANATTDKQTQFYCSTPTKTRASATTWPSRSRSGSRNSSSCGGRRPASTTPCRWRIATWSRS